MIAIVHSIYSQSVHAPALNAGLMDNDAEWYCKLWNCFITQNRLVSNKTLVKQKQRLLIYTLENV